MTNKEKKDYKKWAAKYEPLVKKFRAKGYGESMAKQMAVMAIGFNCSEQLEFNYEPK